MSSKENEYACLNRVIQAAKHQHGKSKRILDLLTCDDFARSDDERPDFVKLCPPQQTSSKNRLLGIEHFQVDHFSIEQKSGKIGSTINKYKKDLIYTQSYWNGMRNQTGTLPYGALEDTADLIAKNLKMRHDATYNAFISAFGYSLDLHLKKVDEYRENLQTMSMGKYQIELAFLIEIYSDFTGWFSNTNGNVKRLDSKFLPFFEDIICLLEKIDTKKVTYIILCFNDSMDGEKVIALRTGAIRQQLRNRHIKTYQYSGDDIFLSGFQRMQKDLNIDPTVSIEGENIIFGVTVSSREMDMENRARFVMAAFRRALALQKRKQDFVTTHLVQSMLEIYGDYFLKSDFAPENITLELCRLIEQYHPEEIATRKKTFEEKWGEEQS